MSVIWLSTAIWTGTQKNGLRTNALCDKCGKQESTEHFLCKFPGYALLQLATHNTNGHTRIQMVRTFIEKSRRFIGFMPNGPGTKCQIWPVAVRSVNIPIYSERQFSAKEWQLDTFLGISSDEFRRILKRHSEEILILRIFF